MSFVFPGLSHDPIGDQQPNEWEIKLTCHFDKEHPYMTWWSESLEEALSDCEREVAELFERMEADSLG